jgi:hypothetical protein
MIAPWAKSAWELNHDQQAYGSLIKAARSLSLRYNSKTQCLRSWDTCDTKRYHYDDPTLDFLVIIVSDPQ